MNRRKDGVGLWRGGWLLALMWWAASAALAAGKEEAAPAAPSQYINLTPAFVANYGGPGPIHFLKTEIALRVAPGDAPAEAAVQHHMPYIRHVLVMLLSRQTSEALATMEGKEQLRQDALTAVRGVLEQEEGKPYVDDLLFNSFIVQR